MKKSERERLERLKQQVIRTVDNAESGTLDRALDRFWCYLLAARYPPTRRQIRAAQRLGVDPYEKRFLSEREYWDQLVQIALHGSADDEDYKLTKLMLSLDFVEGEFPDTTIEAMWPFTGFWDRLLWTAFFVSGMFLLSDDEDKEIEQGREFMLELLRKLLQSADGRVPGATEQALPDRLRATIDQRKVQSDGTTPSPQLLAGLGETIVSDQMPGANSVKGGE
jgi:hypothetical protein